MTCCTVPTRCVGCEVDGIPLAGADWISDEWMLAMAPTAHVARAPSVPRLPPIQGLSKPRSRPSVRRMHRGGRSHVAVVRRGNPPAPIPGAEVILVDRPQRLFAERHMRGRR